MNRCVVVGASCLNVKLKDYIQQDDFIIAVDGGYLHCQSQEVKPNLIIGDFDSSKTPTNVEDVVVLPTEKDDTDTFYVAKYIVDNNFQEVIMFAMTQGKRVEHTIANIQTLNYLSKHNVQATLIDEYSQISIISNQEITLEKQENKYFSLFSLGYAKGVSVKNAKYSIEDVDINDDFPVGISNEFMSEDVVIEVKKGHLILIITNKE